MKFILNKANALINLILGILLSLPFIYVSWFTKGASLLAIFSLFLLMIGGPLFFIGLVLFFSKTTHGDQSTIQSDVSRIRHAMDQERINKKG